MMFLSRWVICRFHVNFTWTYPTLFQIHGFFLGVEKRRSHLNLPGRQRGRDGTAGVSQITSFEMLQIAGHMSH